jgi:hypothetical protein
MECPRYIQLRRHYEAALRRWEQVILLPGAESNSAPARLAAEIKQKALEERVVRLYLSDSDLEGQLPTSQELNHRSTVPKMRRSS